MNKENIEVFFKLIKMSLKTSPLRFLTIQFLSFIEGLLPIVSILIVRFMIDSISTTPLNNILILQYASTWLIIAVLSQCLPVLSAAQIEILKATVSTKIDLEAMKKSLNFQGIKQFENPEFHHTRMMLFFCKHMIESFLYHSSEFIKDIIRLISVFILFLVFEWWIPAILVISVIPGIIFASLTAKKKIDLQELQEESQANANYVFDLAINATSAKELRLFNYGPLLQKKYSHIALKLKERQKATANYEKRWNLLSAILRVIPAGIIMIYLTLGVIKGTISLGLFIMFVQSVFEFTGAVLQAGSWWTLLEQALSTFQRYYYFLRETDSLNLTGTKTAPEEINNIVFEHVSFAYNENEAVLHDVCFTISRGEIIALVGENGAGKSTIVKLLMRLYDPSSGKILLNGIDIREFDIESYRALLSAVFQDYTKYEFSFSENISPDGDISRLDKNLITTVLSEQFLENLKDGNNTILGTQFGGRNLSGGEWQRIAILRGLAKPNQLFLVDEPTASIDPIQEGVVFDMITTFHKNITFLVTHRLGYIHESHKVIVLKNGKIEAIGSHNELLKESAYYNNFYESQAAMYQGGK